MPDSAVYELYSKKKVPRSNPAATKFSALIDFKHDFAPFASSYDSVENPFTNITEQFSGCLGTFLAPFVPLGPVLTWGSLLLKDYIFHETDSMETVELLENPLSSTNEEHRKYLTEYVALPNPYYPSDHIPIMAKLQWKTNR